MARKQNGPQPRENGSFELPVLDLPSTHPCHGCADCCRYVAVEIDPPTVPKDYDQIHWYLAHRDVSVYVDWEGDWYVEFKTLCENLTGALTCASYRERPELCSDFSVEECEKTTHELAHRALFKTPSEFLEWFQARRPRSFERYMNFRRALIEKRERESKDPAPRRRPQPSRARARGTGGVQSSTSI